MKPMRTIALPLLAASSLLALAACGDSSTDLTRTFGLNRDAPDEFRVTTRAPLSMPPDFALRPPQPGAARPQENSQRQQAEGALAPQAVLNSPASGAPSPGQQALMDAAGPAAPPDIRQKITQDAALEGDRSLTDRILFWRNPNAGQPILVDPARERQRLQENAAMGESPRVGDTPIIQPREKGFLERLGDWF